VKVDAFLGDGEVMRNNVTLNYADANGNPYDEESDYVDVVCTAPVMTITKTVDKDKADPGDTLVYTIVYENEGSGNATNVVIEDTLPADTTFVSATPSGYVKVGDTLTWTFALVEGNSNGTITITVTVDAGVADGTILRNNVTLNYEDQNGNEQGEEGDSTETVVTAPVMTFTKIASVSKADPDDTIVYTLTYNNSGDGNATLVEIEDTIPAGDNRPCGRTHVRFNHHNREGECECA
jgi:uncharacterized repeat protein (TIGR01451 family)